MLGGILIPFTTVRPAFPLPVPQTSDSVFTRAAESIRAKDYEGAEKLYRQALLESPDDPELLKALGTLNQQEGKFQESIDIFQKILNRHPDPSVPREQIQLRLAIAQAHGGDQRQAEKTLAELNRSGGSFSGMEESKVIRRLIW